MLVGCFVYTSTPLLKFEIALPVMFNEIWGDEDEEEGDYDDGEHHLVGLDKELGVVDNG